MQRSFLILAILALTSIGATRAGDWPQWRGPDRTDISTETGLMKSWPEGGPRKLWTFESAGLGYSGFAIANGQLFTMGGIDGTEMLIAADATSGEPMWRTAVGELLKNGWGDGPRSTPTVDGPHVYALGGRGDLVCANAKTGKKLWSVDIKEFGGRIPNWGYCESVLVDGDKVVCTPGGKQGAVVALNKQTGELIWQSKDFTQGAQYSSIIIANHNGKRQYIQLTQKELVGLDSEDGSVLWSTDWHGRTAVIPTPIFDNGYVYITSGYGQGCKLIRLGDNNEVEVLYDKKIMTNHHGGAILLDGHVYGYSDGRGWICQELLSGEMVWNEKSELKKGAIACADGLLYCLEENSGTLVLIEATPDGWNEKGRFRLEVQSENRSPRGKIWTHPVISNGKLYLRDQEFITCYDIKAS